MTSETIPQNKWRGRIFRFAPLILWIGVIFYLSSSQGSMSNTSRFVRPLLEWLFPSAAEETLLVYHGYIRKLAHLTVYAVLGFWSWRAFAKFPAVFLQKNWFVVSLILVTIVAALDETNQSFNQSRTGSVYDVLLDVTGGAAMLAILYFIHGRERNRTLTL